MTLEDAGVTLFDCVHKTPPAQPVGLPYIAIPQMKEGRLDFADARKITPQDFSDWTKKALPQVDDVVLSRRCNPGTTAAVKDGTQFALGQNLVLLRSDGSQVFPEFLQWLVRGRDWWIEIGRFINVGAVFDSLRCADVPKFELPIPPLDEQRAIASVLGSLDDKIELNRRMNRTLEQMAAAIFKAWFVDFEPVRAKASGAASFPGMSQPVFDAFPATFADSELGPIPEGWEVKSLDVIAEFLNGLALQKFPSDEGPSLPRLKIAQLRKGDTEGAELSNSKMAEKYIIRDGDIIFSWSGSLLVKIWTGGKAALNQHLFKVTSEHYPPWLYYLWTARHLEDFQRTASSKATTMGHIKRHHLSDAKVVVPPTDAAGILALMTDTIQPLLNLTVSNGLESRSLADTRDALLPKLLSGEIRVGQTDCAGVA